MKQRVLVVEDEMSMAAVLKDNLEGEGFEVRVVSDGREALSTWQTYEPDLVVLDVMLPHMDGVSVARRMRSKGFHTPILFLSARGEPQSRMEGLEAGGDDYMAKPFHLREFLLRVGAMLRRQAWHVDQAGTRPGFSFGEYHVDYLTWTAEAAGGRKEIMGERELAIFKLLASKPSQVVSRDEILDEVWGKDVFPSSRTIDNFVMRLRRLFEPDSAHPVYFHSVWGVGYRFTPDPQPAAEPEEEAR